MPADPRRVKELFVAALDLADPVARQAFLDRECGGDAGLRDRVDVLLRAHDQPASALASPAGPGTEAYRDPTEPLGTVIAGRYKLLQQIGEGGFGVVYMAEQETPVRRLVALKIIKPGMDTAQVIARFESERQALAIMDHPNIAKVLDAGATESGRPFFVMELVKGVPVTEFCDKNHMPAGQRLKLFIDVCHAIQHAHHKGVIHRDIKPSNVMVTLHDGVPVVKVIDFGVAKAVVQKLTERTLFTAYGQMVGTPAYMSPEQAEMSGLDIDTRSDIYSLGVLLYELLTGTTPLESRRLREAGYAEMQRLIREEEAPRPSTRLSALGDSATVTAGNRGTDPKQLARLLAGDLDWIVMKALEKDRNRRYASPGTFAEDVERYLRHDAILARPPSAAYRLKKLAQRNRAAVLAGSLVLLALVAGIIGTTWGLIRAEQARRAARAAEASERLQREEADRQRALAEQGAGEARARRDEAERQRARAEESFQLARGAVDRYLAKVGSSPRLERAGLQTLRKELLEEAGNFYEQLIRLRSDDPGMKVELADALLGFAAVARGNGSTQKAIERTERAVVLFEELAAADPANDEYQSKLAAACATLGATLEGANLRRAEASYKKALAIQERLTAARPQDESRQAALARMHYGYASICHRAGQLESAIALGEKARGTFARLAAAHPDDKESDGSFKNREAASLINLGLMYFEARRFDQAETALNRALLLFRELSRAEPQSTWLRSGVGRSLVNLGNLYQSTARLQQAETAYKDVLAIYQELAREDPEMTRWHESVAMTWSHLATLYRTTHRPDQAREAVEEVCAVWAKLSATYPGETKYKASHGAARAKRAAVWVEAGRVAEAVAEVAELTKLDRWNAAQWYNFACVYALASDKDAARKDEHAARAVELLRRAVRAGYKDAAHMAKDTDLDALRGRDDFKQLLDALPKPAKP